MIIPSNRPLSPASECVNFMATYPLKSMLCYIFRGKQSKDQSIIYDHNEKYESDWLSSVLDTVPVQDLPKQEAQRQKYEFSFFSSIQNP